MKKKLALQNSKMNEKLQNVLSIDYFCASFPFHIKTIGTLKIAILSVL